MMIRIRFTREEPVKFLGHLDIMRSFQRCFLRANVRMVYSIGFNPHQKMNFAQPLGVGITSEGEYLDAEIVDGQDPEEICRRLNDCCGRGFTILSVRQIEEGAEKAMAAVKYASYEVAAAPDIAPDMDWYRSLASLMAVKKTKKTEKEIDLKPLVYSFEQIAADEDGAVYSMVLSAGSEDNLKPELLLRAMAEKNGREFRREMIRIHRIDLMAEGFISLENYQTVR